MRSSTAYIIFAAIVILVGFLLMPGALSATDRMKHYYFFFGNAAVWTVLFAIGLLRYGKQALWLLVAAPVAFYPLTIYLLFVCVDLRVCTL
jgi:hypothetical protein